MKMMTGVEGQLQVKEAGKREESLMTITKQLVSLGVVMGLP